MIIETLLTLTAIIVIAGVYVAYRKRQQAQVPALSTDEINQLPLMRLQPKITWCKYLENVDALGTRLAEQFGIIRQVGQLSFKVLRQKFSEQELTFGRYEKTLNDTMAVLADNVAKVIPLLEALDQFAQDDTLKKQALIERIDKLLTLNQTLLEKLNELITNLSDIKSLSGPDQQTADFLLDNLKTMTERAKLY